MSRIIGLNVLLLAMTLAAMQPGIAMDRDGVIDCAGHYVIAPEYKYIEYLGHGLFKCLFFEDVYGPQRKVNPNLLSKLSPGERKQIDKWQLGNFVVKDSNGKDVKINLPPSCELAQIAILDLESSKVDHIQGYPHSALLKIVGPDGFGVVDAAGKVLLEPKFPKLEISYGYQIRASRPDLGTGKAKEVVLSFKEPPLDDICRPRPSARQDFYDQRKDPWYALLAAKYLNVRHLADGFYQVETPSDDHMLVVNEKGKVLFKFAKGFYVANATAETVAVTNLCGNSKLGKDVIFYDRKGVEKKRIHCDLHQTLFRNGMATISRSGPSLGEAKSEAVIDDNGNFIEPFQLAHFTIAEPDRIIKQTYDPRFIRTIWLKKTNDRGWQFHNLLSEYDLIGMNKARVIDILGPCESNEDNPSVSSYIVGGIGSFCGNACHRRLESA